MLKLFSDVEAATITLEQHGLKPGQIMMALRMIVTGTKETPAIDAVLSLVGRERTRERMKAGLSL